MTLIGRIKDAFGTQSILVDENPDILYQQRKKLQQGIAQFAKVEAKDPAISQDNAPEGELQNSIKSHPWFEDSQRHDGCNPNVSPVPALNTDARREYDNALRLQLQKKNEAQLQHSSALRPPGM